MRMIFRLQSIYLQEHSTMRNPTIKLEGSPFNDSKMICLGELSLNSHTLEDFCSRFKGKSRYTLILSPNCNMPNKESTLGKGNYQFFFGYLLTIIRLPISLLTIIKHWTVSDWMNPPGLRWLLSYLNNYNNKHWNSEYILHCEFWILFCLTALSCCAYFLYTPQTLRIQAHLVKTDLHALIIHHLSSAVLIPNHPEISIIIGISCVLLIVMMMNIRPSLIVYLNNTLSLYLPPRLFKQPVGHYNPSNQKPSSPPDNALAQRLPSSKILQMDPPPNPLNLPFIEITNDDLAVDDQRNALSLLGIFLGNLPLFPLVISNLKKKEQLIGSISITGLEFGLCQFTFSSESDRQKILKKSPISTNKYFICLADWEPPTPQAVANLIHVPFWIHLCDLPRKYCTIKIGDKLGSLLGQVILTTICEDIASHRLFLRIKVVLNAARPLTTKIRASHNGYPIQSSVRYENIPLLCITCGLLGHDKKHCPRKLQPSSSVSHFSPELRARRGWKQVDEITLRPLPHQPPESLWEPYNSRLNQFQVPAEDVNPLSAFINDPVLMHEPFFQQSPSASSKQEIQITSVEAVAFFQNSGIIPPLLFSFAKFKSEHWLTRILNLSLNYNSNRLHVQTSGYPCCNHCFKNKKLRLNHIGINVLVKYPSAIFVMHFSGPPTVPPQMFDMIPRPQGIVIREPTQEDEYLEQQSPDSVLFKDPSTVLQELTGTSLSQDEIMEEQCAIEAGLSFSFLISIQMSLIYLGIRNCTHYIFNTLAKPATNINHCTFMIFAYFVTDLLSQKVNDPSHTLALASQMVPDSCKRGPAVSAIRSQEGEPSSEPSLQAMDLSSGKAPEENHSEQSTKPRTRKRQSASKKEETNKKQQLEAKKVEAASLNWLHPDK
ncbi:hypothetical protein LINGRAHAP2_LOCUS14315 [Linum grandiflorum]